MKQIKVGENIILLERKPNGGFSIEQIFENVYNQLIKHNIAVEKYNLPYSTGIGSIIRNIFDVFHLRKQLVHITGDVHYCVLGLKNNLTVLTIHDLGFLYQYKGYKGKLIKKIYLDWPVKKAKYITAISDFTKQEIIKATGCLPQRITVISNPVSPLFVYRPKLFNKKSPCFLHIGTHENKNLYKTIQSLKGLSCILLIVGVLNIELLQLLKVTDIRYELYTDISFEEMLLLYERCDAVLFCSLFEGFGMPIIEAQAIGRIVITSNIEPMKEVAGKGAVFVDSNCVKSIRDGIVEVMNNDVLRTNIINAGIDNVKRFDIDNICKQYEKFYATILSTYRKL